MDTDMDGLIARFNDRVNYDAVHAACYARAQESHRAMANYQVRVARPRTRPAAAGPRADARTRGSPTTSPSHSRKTQRKSAAARRMR